MYKKLVKAFYSFFTIWIIVNTVFYFMQPAMIFYPLKDIAATPSSWGLAFEDVNIELENKKKIHGWYLPHSQATKTVLFFHGNGGNISHRRDSLIIFHKLKLNTLIIDYAGYGQSDGTASEKSVNQSAQAAWDYLVSEKQIPAENIIIFGRSLGGAVAVDLAAKVKPAGLILESTFSSVRDMVDKIFPVISNVIYLRYSFDSFNKIKHLRSPVLSIHSPEDEIIPYELGMKLFNGIKTKKEFLQITGGHNDGFTQSIRPYMQSLRAFSESL